MRRGLFLTGLLLASASCGPIWLAAAGVGAATASLGGGGGGHGGGGATTATTTPWAVAAYVMARNDRDAAATPIVATLDASPVPVVYETAFSGFELPAPPFLTTNRYLVQGGKATLLVNRGNVALDDGNELLDFLTNAVSVAPASRYALIIHGHYGGPPHRLGDDTTPPGFQLSLSTLDETLALARGAIGQRKLDLVVLDIPEGATAEVAAVLAKHALFLVAFEGPAPSTGFDLSSLLQTIAASPSSDGGAVATALVNGFPAFVAGASPGEADEAVAAAFDLSRMDQVLTSLDALSLSLSVALRSTGAPAPIGAARRDARAFDVALGTELVDVGALATNLTSATATIGTNVATAAAALQAAGASATLARSVGGAMTGATGLGIYFPRGAAHFDSTYLTESLALPGSWPTFIQQYLSAVGSLPPPTVTIQVSSPTLTGGQPATITGIVSSPGSIEDVTLYVTQPVPTASGTEDVAVFGLPLGPPDAGGNVSWTGPFSFVSISDAANLTSAIYVPLRRQTSGSELYAIDADVEYPNDLFASGDLTTRSVSSGLTVTAWTPTGTDSALAVSDLLTASVPTFVFPRILTIQTDGRVGSTSQVGLGYRIAGGGVVSLALDTTTAPNPGSAKIWLVAEVFGGALGVATVTVTIQ